MALASPRAALLVAAAGMLAGTVAASRSRLAAAIAPPRVGRARAPARLPAALWVVMLALVGTAAALGAIDVAVPAAARENGNVAAAGVLLAVMAVGTVTGSLAGRRAHLAAGRRSGAWSCSSWSWARASPALR